MGTMWIPTPEQEAEIQARIGAEKAKAYAAGMVAMSSLDAANASTGERVKVVAQALLVMIENDPALPTDVHAEAEALRSIIQAL